MLEKPRENSQVLAEFWAVEDKVFNGAKVRIRRNALTTFVILGPKGLTLKM